MQRASVTIGIPTYSRLHYLKESVASALAQTYPNLEILISQNPHPNPTIRAEIAEYCRESANIDSRVRHQLLHKDLGPPANFNAIADSARGEYLMMIGDDDRFLPNAVERLANAVGTETVLVFGKRHVIDIGGRRFEAGSQPGWVETQNRVSAGSLTNPEFWAWRQGMGTETSLIRTRDFRRIRFRESIDMPDLEFFILLAREGGEFIFVPDYVTEYRLHPDSTTGRQFVNYRELVDLLVPLPVTEQVQPYKARILSYLMLNAVIRDISAGEVRHARRLLQSQYFGEAAIPTRICAALPSTLAVPIYKAYRCIRELALGRPVTVS
jgi:glycosyltransferase involved in cell wall biosynthesis